MIAKIFEEEISNLFKKIYEKKLAKKISHVIRTIIFNFFDAKDSYKNWCVAKVKFERFSFLNC